MKVITLYNFHKKNYKYSLSTINSLTQHTILNLHILHVTRVVTYLICTYNSIISTYKKSTTSSDSPMFNSEKLLTFRRNHHLTSVESLRHFNRFYLASKLKPTRAKLPGLVPCRIKAGIIVQSQTFTFISCLLLPLVEVHGNKTGVSHS